MPGRTPAEAVDAFLDPLRDALRVLDGVAKLLISPKGGFRKGVRYSWVLNGADGMDLGAVGRFIASMEFEIIDADPAKNEFGHPFRVTARSYHYKLRGGDGIDQWRMHWHPEGRSRITTRCCGVRPDRDRPQARPELRRWSRTLWRQRAAGAHGAAHAGQVHGVAGRHDGHAGVQRA